MHLSRFGQLKGYNKRPRNSEDNDGPVLTQNLNFREFHTRPRNFCESFYILTASETVDIRLPEHKGAYMFEYVTRIMDGCPVVVLEVPLNHAAQPIRVTVQERSFDTNSSCS